MVRLAALLLLMMAAPAWAHAGHSHDAETISWTWDPGVTVPHYHFVLWHVPKGTAKLE